MRVLIAGAGIAGLTAVTGFAAGSAPGFTEGDGGVRVRLETTSAMVLATREMPVERVIDTVHERAPDGFGRIEDVLSAAELARLRDAYRATSLQDVTTLNERPPLLP